MPLPAQRRLPETLLEPALSTLLAPRTTDLARVSEAKAKTAPPTEPPPAQPSATIDWVALEPDNGHARWTRPLLNGLLLCLCLPLALPIGALVALVNWFSFKDPRQILFLQPRVGHRGQVFTIFKFRTMRATKSGAFKSWSGSGEGDRLRVTPFGRFLRNSHLDELPQLINILRGEMTFIGPRPEMVEIESWAESQVPGFSRRLCVHPGITGLAQVVQGYVGNNAEGYRHKHALAIEYVRRYSLALDLEILVRTALTMVCLRGWRWDPTPRPDSPAGGPRLPLARSPNRLWD